MGAAETDALLRSFRKKPLFDRSALPVTWAYGRAEIERLIPHRPPLLFVDALCGYDPEKNQAWGLRRMDPADPVFAGHFPGSPVYPGNLTVESIGQLGLCMSYFAMRRVSEIGPDAAPMPLRATRILGALFLEPILPGDEVHLLAQQLSFDETFASVIGQALVRDKVAVVMAGEVLFLG